MNVLTHYEIKVAKAKSIKSKMSIQNLKEQNTVSSFCSPILVLCMEG